MNDLTFHGSDTTPVQVRLQAPLHDATALTYEGTSTDSAMGMPLTLVHTEAVASALTYTKGVRNDLMKAAKTAADYEAGENQYVGIGHGGMGGGHGSSGGHGGVGGGHGGSGGHGGGGVGSQGQLGHGQFFVHDKFLLYDELIVVFAVSGIAEPVKDGVYEAEKQHGDLQKQ